MNKIYNILALATLVSLLASCTLMLDEPEIQPEEEVSGDGWSAPVIEKDEISEFRYQYQPGTMVIDETYLPYLQKFEEDTVTNTAKIYLSKKIPMDKVPERNACLSSFMQDYFGSCLCHKVDLIQEEGDSYVVMATRVNANLVYKDFYFESDGVVVGDSTNYRGESCGARIISINEYYGGLDITDWPLSRDISSNEGKQDDEIGLPALDLECDYLKNPAQYVKDEAKLFRTAKFKYIKDNIVKDFKNSYEAEYKNSNKKVIVYGNIDAKFYAKAGLFWQYHWRVNISEEQIEFWIRPVLKLYVGAGIKSIEAHVLVPLAGSIPFTYTNHKNENVIVDSENFIKPIITKPIPIGSTPCSLSFNFATAFDLYAKLANDLTESGEGASGYRGFAIGCEKPLAKFGFDYNVTKKDELHIIKSPAESIDFVWDLPFMTDLNFTIGAKLYTKFSLGIQTAKIFDVNLFLEPCPYVEYKSTNEHKPEISTKIKEDYLQVPQYANNNSMVDGGVSFNVGVESYVDFFVTKKELFKKNLFDTPLSIKFLHYSVNPDFTVYSVNYKNKTNEAYEYRAKVGVTHVGWFNEDIPPYLAIFKKSDKSFVTYVRPNEVMEHDLEEGDVFTFDFSIPNEYLTEDTYYAVPYQRIKTGAVASAIQSKPFEFPKGGEYAKLNKFYNIDYSDFDSEYSSSSMYSYGAAMDVTVNLVEPKAKIIMGISIKDSEGKTIKDFDICLGTATKRVDKKLYFSFYSRAWDLSGFTAVISFVTEDNEGNWEFLEDSFERTIEYGEGLKFPDELNGYKRLD